MVITKFAAVGYQKPKIDSFILTGNNEFRIKPFETHIFSTTAFGIVWMRVTPRGFMNTLTGELSLHVVDPNPQFARATKFLWPLDTLFHRLRLS